VVRDGPGGSAFAKPPFVGDVNGSFDWS